MSTYHVECVLKACTSASFNQYSETLEFDWVNFVKFLDSLDCWVLNVKIIWRLSPVCVQPVDDSEKSFLLLNKLSRKCWCPAIVVKVYHFKWIQIITKLKSVRKQVSKKVSTVPIRFKLSKSTNNLSHYLNQASHLHHNPKDSSWTQRMSWPLVKVTTRTTVIQMKDEFKKKKTLLPASFSISPLKRPKSLLLSIKVKRTNSKRVLYYFHIFSSQTWIFLSVSTKLKMKSRDVMTKLLVKQVKITIFNCSWNSCNTNTTCFWLKTRHNSKENNKI